ncbi:MAG: hypothetical protein LUF28_05515 [Clostridiales bacterium]|nr:hypothetical protein [Clostridiales bacterium]
MYIMSEDGKRVVNAAYVEQFDIDVKPDAALVKARYGTEAESIPAILGRYKDLEEAKNALMDLMMAIVGGQTHYFMPESSYYGPKTVKDARVKRRGGS